MFLNAIWKQQKENNRAVKLEKLSQILPSPPNSGKRFYIKINEKISRLNPVKNYYTEKETKKLSNNLAKTKMSERHTFRIDEDRYLLFQHELKYVKEIIQGIKEQHKWELENLRNEVIEFRK